MIVGTLYPLDDLMQDRRIQQTSFESAINTRFMKRGAEHIGVGGASK